jgi:DNA polymerase III subunit delta'
MPFRQIAGHRHLLERLAHALATGTLPPSLIFSGAEGVGKRASALALAQALNCERPLPWPDEVGRDACGECGACRRIARGVHADLVIVTPGDSGAIKLDQVREAIERSAYRPFEGRRRVVIVDDADALISEAQNALLKTLEEPPPASVFVLVTCRPDVLLPTVRSRCQRLRFGPLAPSELAAVLMRDHGFATADAHAAAAAADGSIGRALDRDAADASVARDAAARLLTSAASAADPRRRLDAAKALGAGAGERGALAERLRALSSLLRDLGALNSNAPSDVLANADLEAVLESARRSFDADRVDKAFAAVDRALTALDRNASPKIVADWVALNL